MERKQRLEIYKISREETPPGNGDDQIVDFGMDTVESTVHVLSKDGDLLVGKMSELDCYRDLPIWIDVSNPRQANLLWLEKYFNIHPLTVEDLSHDQVRAKIEEWNDYLFCVLYGIGKEGLDLLELDYIIGKNFIITAHVGQRLSVERLTTQRKLLKLQLERGVDFLFHKLLDMEIDAFAPRLEDLDDKMEHISDSVMEDPKPEDLKGILNMKGDIIQIRKIVMQQRDKIAWLSKDQYVIISKPALPYFRDVHDHAVRASDQIETLREHVGNIYDMYMSTVSHNMNEVMKVLSVIATLTLPITAISGIYGVNFENLPGSAYEFGFWIMIAFMVSLFVAMLVYFKRRRWF